MLKSKNTGNVFLRMHPLHRVLLSILLTVSVYFLISRNKYHFLQIVIILWDVFAFTYLLSCWIVIFNRSTFQIREQAKNEDGSKFFVFIVILFSSFASMFNVLLLITSKHAQTSEIIFLPLTIAGMLFAWAIVHTMFVFHYAHLYYSDDEIDAQKFAKGLDFPEENKSNYLDFAYFSFVVGMTFQVSDVQITSPVIRKLALVHGLISFFLNTFVVALTINIIAGLKH